MTPVVRHRSLSWIIAYPAVRQGDQGHISLGRQDKSADVGRVHVVGWITVSDAQREQRAGARYGKCREFNASSAVAHDETGRKSS